MNDELRKIINIGSSTANTFIKLYYDRFDKRRQQVALMFLDTGLCVWNGNIATGKENIQKLLCELPNSVHTLTTLDVQPIIDDAVAGQPTYIMQVGGSVKYADKPTKIFQQSFVITAEGDKWKIVSDVYRLQDNVNKAIANDE